MIRWGIIGCGHIASRFASSLKYVSGAAIASVWSRREESVHAFVREFGGQGCTTVEQLLASDIDAVYIATLPDSHALYSKQALLAGKPVLCEKPACVNAEELRHVLAVAKSQKLLFMEGMKPPFYPLYKQLKEYLETDPIGIVTMVRAGCSLTDVPPDHPSFKPEFAGGSLMAIGIYEAFLAVDWLGAANEVAAFSRIGDEGVDRFTTVQTLHQNGMAQLYCGLDRFGAGDALLVASKGRVVIHENWWNPTRATIKYADGRTVELVEPFEGGGLNYEIEHFCTLIREGKKESPVISHQVSINMIEIIDRARRAAGLKFPMER